MTDQQDAWMVTVGEYSDYGVVAVFLTENEAQAWADELNGVGRLKQPHEDFNIERVDLNPPLPSKVRVVK